MYEKISNKNFNTIPHIKKYRIHLKKFIKYNPLDYEDYLLNLSVEKREEFEKRVSFEKVWDNFDQDKFYTEEGSLKNQCGVYCIMNLVDRKKYFGESLKLNIRYNQHFCKLEKNKHENTHLQKSFNEYGKENFIFFIVQFCDFNNLKNVEGHYIESFGDLNKNYLYNFIKEQNGKIKHSKCSKDKMSKSHSKFTYIIVNKNNEIFVESNLNTFSKNIKIDSSDLSLTFNKTVNNSNYQVRGYKVIDKIFGIKNFDENFIREKYKQKIDIFLKFIKDGAIQQTVKYIIINPKLEIVIAFNVTQYCKENNLKQSDLSGTLYGKGYHTKYHKILYKLRIEEELKDNYSEQIETHKNFILKNNYNNVHTIENRNGERKVLTKFDLMAFCKYNKMNFDNLQKNFNRNKNNWFVNNWRIIHIERTIELN